MASPNSPPKGGKSPRSVYSTASRKAYAVLDVQGLSSTYKVFYLKYVHCMVKTMVAAVYVWAWEPNAYAGILRKTCT